MQEGGIRIYVASALALLGTTLILFSALSRSRCDFGSPLP